MAMTNEIGASVAGHKNDNGVRIIGEKSANEANRYRSLRGVKFTMGFTIGL